MTFELDTVIVEIGQNPLNLNLKQTNYLIDELQSFSRKITESLDENDLSKCFHSPEASITVSGYVYSLESLLDIRSKGEIQ